MDVWTTHFQNGNIRGSRHGGFLRDTGHAACLRYETCRGRPICLLTPQPTDRGRADFIGLAVLSTALFPLKGEVSNSKGIFDEIRGLPPCAASRREARPPLPPARIPPLPAGYGVKSLVCFPHASSGPRRAHRYALLQNRAEDAARDVRLCPAAGCFRYRSATPPADTALDENRLKSYMETGYAAFSAHLPPVLGRGTMMPCGASLCPCKRVTHRLRRASWRLPFF